MATITADVPASARQIAVSTASATQMPFLFKLDTEVLECTGGGGTLFWAVRRGVDSTIPALHVSGGTITEVAAVLATVAAAATAVVPNSAAAAAVTSFTGGEFAAELAFVANGAGTYVGTVAIPAGATVVDVDVRNTVVWDSGTSASLTVGDDDNATGYIAATNVKTTPAADTNGAGQGLSTELSLGATAGVYKGGAGKYCAVAKTITATIVAVGAGVAGRTRVLVRYVVPASAVVTQ